MTARLHTPAVFDGRPLALSDKVSDAMRRGFDVERKWAGGLAESGGIDEMFAETCRAIIGAFGVDDNAEAVITSSGDESINSAIKGLLPSLGQDRRGVCHVAGDWMAIAGAAHWCENFGFDSVNLPLASDGDLDWAAADRLITKETAIVALSSVTPEVHARRDMVRLHNLAKRAGSYVIVDVSDQARVEFVGEIVPSCDLMTCDGNAIGAPVGSGALFISPDARWHPMIAGGAEQGGRRGGRFSAGLLCGLGAAAEEYRTVIPTRRGHYERLFAMALGTMQSHLPGAKVIQGRDPLPCGLIALLPDVEAESIVLKLRLQNIFIGSGSACFDAAGKPSAVMTALGVSAELASGSVRLEFRPEHTESEVREVLVRLSNCYNELRGWQ